MRAPPYQKKIDLRKKLWQTILGILEAGQVENQQLITVGDRDYTRRGGVGRTWGYPSSCSLC